MKVSVSFRFVSFSARIPSWSRTSVAKASFFCHVPLAPSSNAVARACGGRSALRTTRQLCRRQRSGSGGAISRSLLFGSVGWFACSSIVFMFR